MSKIFCFHRVVHIQFYFHNSATSSMLDTSCEKNSAWTRNISQNNYARGNTLHDDLVPLC